MIEKVFEFTTGENKTIEKVLEDERVGINHMTLPKGESLPLHNANSNVYMIVARGTISLILDDNKQNDYPYGSIINIPLGTKMNAFNENDAVTELFVVKSPAPGGINN